MHKVLEIFYTEKSATSKLRYYKEKGLAVTKNPMRAQSSFLDIYLWVRSRDIMEKVKGYEFDSIEFDYYPAREILLAAKARSKQVIVMGIEA